MWTHNGTVTTCNFSTVVNKVLASDMLKNICASNLFGVGGGTTDAKHGLNVKLAVLIKLKEFQGECRSQSCEHIGALGFEWLDFTYKLNNFERDL